MGTDTVSNRDQDVLKGLAVRKLAIAHDPVNVERRKAWLALDAGANDRVMILAERFGKVYYGCCEPVNNRWHILKGLPNLARVSISPWADQTLMAEALGRNYVFSRKPNPAMISTGTFDEATIRADLRQTIDATKGCRLEIIMKDVHTLNNEPERLARWVRIAREEVERRG